MSNQYRKYRKFDRRDDKLYVMWKLPEEIFEVLVKEANGKDIIFCIDFHNCTSFLYSLWQNKYITQSGIIQIDDKNQILLSINELAGLIIEDMVRRIGDLKALGAKYNTNVKVVFFSDIGHSKFHSQLAKTYKENRVKAYQSIADPVLQCNVNLVISARKLAEKIMYKILNTLPGVAYILLDQLESDFIPLFVQQLNPDSFIVTLSNDTDMFQLVSQNHNVVRKINKKNERMIIRVDLSNVGKYMYPVDLDKYRVHIQKSVKHYTFAKAIMGDPTDDIRGIKNYGPVKTIQLVSNIVDEFGDNFENKLDDVFEHFPILKRYKKKVLRNYKLIDFNFPLEYFYTEEVEQVTYARKLITEINQQKLAPHEIVGLFKIVPTFREYQILREQILS